MKRDYREKVVLGMIADAKTMKHNSCPVTVRMTNDKRGKSLSLSAFNILIAIPLESVQEIIKLTEPLKDYTGREIKFPFEQGDKE